MSAESPREVSKVVELRPGERRTVQLLIPAQGRWVVRLDVLETRTLTLLSLCCGRDHLLVSADPVPAFALRDQAIPLDSAVGEGTMVIADLENRTKETGSLTVRLERSPAPGETIKAGRDCPIEHKHFHLTTLTMLEGYDGPGSRMLPLPPLRPGEERTFVGRAQVPYKVQGARVVPAARASVVALFNPLIEDGPNAVAAPELLKTLLFMPIAATVKNVSDDALPLVQCYLRGLAIDGGPTAFPTPLGMAACSIERIWTIAPGEERTISGPLPYHARGTISIKSDREHSRLVCTALQNGRTSLLANDGQSEPLPIEALNGQPTGTMSPGVHGVVTLRNQGDRPERVSVHFDVDCVELDE